MAVTTQDTHVLSWDSRPLINGLRCSSASTERTEIISPRDGEVLYSIANGSSTDVDCAVESARAAYESGVWSGLSARERGRILCTLGDLLENNATELSQRICREMGKPIRDAANVELVAAAQCFRWYGQLADKLCGEIPTADPGSLALITREPAGVVAAVVPWNFPLTMAAWKVAPALVSGNSVVLKPAEQTSVSALRLGELALHAGVPAGILNVVPGRGDTVGEALGRHGDVDVIAFTGSVEVGRRFLLYSAESNGKRVWPELGGKSAAIILEDADVDAAGRQTAWGAFYNQGQMCSASSRMIVHRSVHDRALRAACAQAARMVPSDPLDTTCTMGPMVTEHQLDRTISFVRRALADGAILESGRPERFLLGSGRGSYLAPIIVTNIRPDMEISQTEVFGPVLSVIDVDSVDDAIAVANGTPYGLAAGLWTKDLTRAHQISRRLRAGTVWVNCYEEGDMSMPFGGVGASGFGRDKGFYALEKYTDVKSTWIELGS